jgi:thiamine pyrophosphokinase
MDGKAFIFLNGLYPRGDQLLVRGQMRGTRPRPVVVAVNGGIGFLRKIKIRPDYWISDLDSAPRLNKGFLKGIESLVYPESKDKTDAELSIDLCARKGLADITIFGWEVRRGETDHLLGSLLLGCNLTGIKRRLKLRFLSSRQEIIAIRNETRVLRGQKGRRLSIVPLTGKIILTLQGTRYPASGLDIRMGETISLRNQITAKRAVIRVEGAALAVIGEPVES